MKILLAIDNSEASQAAVSEVARRPWPPGTSVEVLNVVEPAHLWAVSVVAEEAVSDSKELAQKAAEQLPSATSKSVQDDPRHAILDRAKEIYADLIVVGSHTGSP